MILKHRNIWPIELKPARGRMPFAFHKVGVGISLESQPKVHELYIKCPIILKVYDRKSLVEITQAKLTLTDNDHQWYGYDARFPDGSSIIGRQLKEIPDAIYELSFTVTLDDTLKEWYNNYPSNVIIYATINIAVIEDWCIASLGEIKR